LIQSIPTVTADQVPSFLTLIDSLIRLLADQVLALLKLTNSVVAIVGGSDLVPVTVLTSSHSSLFSRFFKT
jgi:hypothetical protein